MFEGLEFISSAFAHKSTYFFGFFDDSTIPTSSNHRPQHADMRLWHRFVNLCIRGAAFETSFMNFSTQMRFR